MDKSTENKGWNSMSVILDKELPTNKKRPILPWIFILVLLSTLTGVGGYYFGKNSLVISSNLHATATNDSENYVVKNNMDFTTEALQSVDITTLDVKEKQTIPNSILLAKKETDKVEESSTKVIGTITYFGKQNSILQSDPSDNISSEKEFNVYIDKSYSKIINETSVENLAVIDLVYEEGVESTQFPINEDVLQSTIIENNNDITDNPLHPYNTELQTDITNNTTKNRKNSYWIASSINNHIQNLKNTSISATLGLELPLNKAFNVYGMVGGSYRNLIETQGQALLSKSYLDTNASNTSSLKLMGKHNVAEITYKHAFSGYAGAGLRYKLASRWSIFSGLAYQYLLGVKMDPVKHAPNYADGTPNPEVLYPEEIINNYPLVYNHNMLYQGGISWSIASYLSIDALCSYTFRPFIRHSLTTSNGREQMIGLQLRYNW